MEKTMVIQGRDVTPDDLQFIRQFIDDNPSWSRYRLSKELCALWDWRDLNGRIKDMACRTFLLKLHRRGHISLPAPLQGTSVRKKSIQPVMHATAPITGDLSDVRPLRIETVSAKTYSADLFRTFLSQYHYLDYTGPVGENLKYLVFDNRGVPLACLLFGAAAWSAAPRDRVVGWESETRKSNLHLLANNSRFLILPWVRIPHLASHLLGKILRRISQDWIRKYNHPVHLLETFVEKDRFEGVCYAASNWSYAGDTKGRTRNDRRGDIKAPVKKIYLYPLRKNFRERLCRKRS